MHFSTLFSAAALSQLAVAGYTLQDDYMSGGFYDNFDFFTDPDPTHGFVKYVDQGTAQSSGLLNASTGGIGWGVDTTTKDQGGRASVRLVSKKVYNHGLVVIDVEHMPVGCGTWPAFWMVGPDWPTHGEIDIIEGVHEQESNSITLHTGPGCSIGSEQGVFSGDVATKNCDIKAEGQAENQGCSVGQNDNKSYGKGLNSNGGGVFATEWTSDAITVWFFPRGSEGDALGANPDPSTWGKPAAKFASSGCDIDKFFDNQNIVFDTTFCGDWAGKNWGDSCAAKTGVSTCNEYVQNNPEAFKEAFWSIKDLKVYSSDGSAAPAPGPSGSGKPKPTKSSASSANPTDGPEPTSDGPAPTSDVPGMPTPSDAPGQSDSPTPSDSPVTTKTPPAGKPTPLVPSAPSTSGFESPPIIDTSAPPAGPTIQPVDPPAPAPTTKPKPSWTRTWGGQGGHGHGGHRNTMRSADPFASAVVGGDTAATAEPAAPQPAAPSQKVEKGSMGGFTWPVGKGGVNKPQTTTSSATGNSTVPTTTAANAPGSTGGATPSSMNPSGAPSSVVPSMPPVVTSATTPGAIPSSGAAPAQTPALPSPVNPAPVGDAPSDAAPAVPAPSGATPSGAVPVVPAPSGAVSSGAAPVAPAPSGLAPGSSGAAPVYETLTTTCTKTVQVTVTAEPTPTAVPVVNAVPASEALSTTTSCTKEHPAETAAARHARHARNHRRMLTKHHARK